MNLEGGCNLVGHFEQKSDTPFPGAGEFWGCDIGVPSVSQHHTTGVCVKLGQQHHNLLKYTSTLKYAIQCTEHVLSEERKILHSYYLENELTQNPRA